MKPPTEQKREQDTPQAKRTLLSRLTRKKPTTERRRADDQDEIDERELDKISGGRIHRIDI
jgi:hypothetical protein